MSEEEPEYTTPCIACGWVLRCPGFCPLTRNIFMGREALERQRKIERNRVRLGGSWEAEPSDESWESIFVRSYTSGNYDGLLTHLGDLVCNLDMTLVSARSGQTADNDHKKLLDHRKRAVRHAIDLAQDVVDRLFEAHMLLVSKSEEAA